MDDQAGENRPKRPETTPQGHPAGPHVLVVCPVPHPVCDPVAGKLGDLGCAVARTDDVYQAVVSLTRDHARFAVAIVAVDFLNRDELRLFPMAKRRWPALRLVAVSRPAFAYKVSIAELAGADLVITDAEAVAPLVESLGLSTSRARELPPRADAPPASPPPEIVPTPPADQPPMVARAPQQDGAGDDDESSAAPPRRKPPRSPQVIVPDASQEILTEEEISALMADMDDDDQESQLMNGTEND